MVHIVEKARAQLTGIYALISVGSEWKNSISCPVETALELPKKVLKPSK